MTVGNKIKKKESTALSGKSSRNLEFRPGKEYYIKGKSWQCKNQRKEKAKFRVYTAQITGNNDTMSNGVDLMGHRGKANSHHKEPT